MSTKTLIRGGCVLTLGAKTPNFLEADVLIEDGRVAEVGYRLRARASETVDGTDTIVMPGFVDVHRHVWQSLLRNLGDAASAERYGVHYRPEDVYAATLIGLLGAVEAGITTVVDWSDIQVDRSYTDAALAAHADAGLRTVLVHSKPNWADGQNDVDSLRQLTKGRAEVPDLSTGLAYGSPDPHRDNLDSLSEEWVVARELSLRIHTHVGMDRSEQGVVSELGRRGVLGKDVNLVHCSHLDDADFDAVAASGASVSLTPANEMAGGLGSPPIQKLINRGLRPGLGTATEKFAPGDLFSQMRSTISVQHATYFELKLAGKAGLPNLLTTREVIRYATVDGARVAGLGEVTGSIEPGMAADLIVLRTDRPNIAPVNDPIGAVVWGMDTSNVDWVFSGGRALMRHGALVADVAQARQLAMTALHRVTAASGLLLTAPAKESA